MRNIFNLEIARSVRGSLGRFLAIMGIVALGCGFFAGLKMTGPDMRSAADAYYDGMALYDVRLVSTMGFEDADVARVRDVEGVGAVMPAKTFDAMASMGNQQVAVRVSSIDTEEAAGSVQASPYEITSDDADYLNRPRLVEGSWPQNAHECVISADKLVGDVSLGSTVQLLSSTSDLGSVANVTEFTVVGLVSAPQYPYNGSFGSTTLGSGSIEQYLFVENDAFAADMPYTELYLTVEGARGQAYGSDAYTKVVNQVKSRLEASKNDLAEERLRDVRTSVQSEVDEAQAELSRNRADAEQQIADARSMLDASRLELRDGWAQYASGAERYTEGERELRANEAEALRKLAEGQSALDSHAATLRGALDSLQAGEQSYAEGLSSYTEGEQQVLTQLNVATLDEAASALAAQEAAVRGAAEQGLDGVRQLQDAQAQLDSSIADGRDALDDQEKSLRERERQLAAVRDEMEGKRAQLSEGEKRLAEALGAYGIKASTAEEALAGINELLARGQNDEDTSRTSTIANDHQPSAPPEGQTTTSGEKASGDEPSVVEDVPAHLSSRTLQALQEARQIAEQLVAGKQQLEQYDDTLAQVEQGKRKIAAGRAQLESKRSQGQEQIDAGTARLLESLQGKGIQASTLDEAAEALRAQEGDALAAISRARTGVEELQQGAAQLEASRSQLDAGWAAYNQGASELAQGQAILNTQAASAREQLDAAQAELERARVALAASLGQLQAGEQAYQDGASQLRERKSDAQRELAEGQRQIDEAQEDIDALEAPQIYTLDRSQCEGCATYEADSERMDHIAQVFPLIFFLVAALVALTTMTRMVESERVEIGTYKALGYRTSRIASKYLAYAACAGIAGAVVGIGVLSQVLPAIITWAYSIIYVVPLHPFPLPVNLPIALVSGGIGVGVTLLATWWAVVASLREAPATLMLPRVPKAGKRILLERVEPLWRRLSFSWKVTFRNLFRYKRRLFMTIVGIAGCAALLLTGFGLHDSIWDIIASQYGPIIHYDVTVGMASDATDDEMREVESYLRSSGQLKSLVRVQGENLQAGSASYDGTLRVNVVVPRSSDELGQAVTLRDRRTHNAVPFDDSSVVITEKAASLLGVRPGDTISLYGQDDIGNATGTGTELTVTGVTENYVGNYVYLGRKAWSAVDPSTPRFLTVLATTTQDSGFYNQASEALHGMGGVSTVAFSKETIDLYRSMLSVVNLVVVVLIVSAALLAAIVLFNLTNVNISERVREIASLKVLGFTRREVYSYVFREVLLLAVMGDVVGMVLGVFLEQFVITAAEVDYVMFGRVIHPASFAISFALTLVFTIAILLLMRKKLDAIDMVESLKSVD